MRLLDFLFQGRDTGQAQFLAGQSPVIIMGRGHSGTRVLTWLCTHLGIQLGFGEDSKTCDVSDRRFQKVIRAIALRSLDVTRTAQVHPALLRRFQRAAFDYYAGLGKPASHWGWKFPETYLIGPCVATTFPKARYLHLLRDGRDLAFKRHDTDDPNKKLGRAILRIKGALRQPRHLQAAHSWAFQVEQFAAFCTELSPGQVLEINFGRLCTHPTEIVNQLCEFLKIPMTEACQRYISEKIDTGKVQQHRLSDPRLVQEVEESIGDTLKRHQFIN